MIGRRLVLHPVAIWGLACGVPTRSVSEDEAAIQGIPRSRFGLVSEPPTLILKLDAALGRVDIRPQHGKAT